MIEFGAIGPVLEHNITSLDFDNNDDIDVIKTFPSSKLKQKGFRVNKIGDNMFKIRATRNRVVSKLSSIEGTEFVEQILAECEDESCELKAFAPKNYWAVERLTDNTFIIKRA